MSRPGSRRSLVDPLHAEGCDGEPTFGVQPVVVPEGGDQEPTYFDHERGARIEVVYMEICPRCGAADWEVV